MKNPDFLQPWGCPWHGLIKNGQLHLPEGKTLAWPQPTNGDTHLIDFGVPAVDTPAEQSAEGMLWLNKAIICGRTIHGVQLPEGSWIYRDSNEENWLVTTDLHGSSAALPSRQVKLTRFGVLGGEKIEHTYSVPCPDFRADIDAAYVSEPVPGYMCHMFSARPRGGGAIFRVGGGDQSYQYPTSSWLQVQLSGPADNCSIDISILRSAEQTKGVRLDQGVDDFGVSKGHFYQRFSVVDLSDDRGEPPECGGTLVQQRIIEPSSNYNSTEEYFVTIERPGISIEGVSGVIIGMVYRADGGVSEITASLKRTVSASVSLSRESDWPTRTYDWAHSPDLSYCVSSIKEETTGFYSRSMVQSASFKAEVSISLNGVESISDSYEYSYEVSDSAELRDMVFERPVLGAYGVGWSEITNSVSGPGGRQSHTYNSETAGQYAMPPHFSGSQPALPAARQSGGLSAASLAIRVADVESMDLSSYYYSRGPYPALMGDPGSSFGMDIRPVVYANGVYGIIRVSDEGTASHPQVVTPDGTKTAPEGRYASYNPLTGEVARSTNRVNWT